MSTFTIERNSITAKQVQIDEETLTIELADGRTISAPIAWFPRLFHGTSEERNNWRLIGSGEGIHWPDLDEDISIKNILLGESSSESQRSFKRWLEQRVGAAQVST